MTTADVPGNHREWIEAQAIAERRGAPSALPPDAIKSLAGLISVVAGIVAVGIACR